MTGQTMATARRIMRTSGVLLLPDRANREHTVAHPPHTADRSLMRLLAGVIA
ncbi:hypothetical protein AB0H76_18720 [Nocardia sp. NPDC050712]|uniref:hypothetical protein n=1 Tax=Nocardia sp. NPDC050712 TaxID=3155518 RepID=UPI0033C4B38B